jgi:UDP-N-acetylmuramate dehydrogenase
MQVGGVALEYYVPETVAELQATLAELAGRRPFILGGGCNTIFPDEPFSRPIISTEKLRRVELGERSLRAEAGVRIDSLIRAAIESGLGGLEGLVGIPGTVGGAVAMNAGGSGWEFGALVREIGAIPAAGGEIAVLDGMDIPWGYRSWNLSGWVAAWVLLELSPASTAELRQRARECFRQKHQSQPLAEPSSGCIFKNPPGHSAGRLIESLGLKGLRRGGAMVSERHANFIVNRGGRARASDVVGLVEEVRSRVEEAYNVRLETEVVLAAGDGPLR